MTVKEAIKNIDAVLSADVHYDESIDYLVTTYDIEWLEMAKKALERAEKKKPKHRNVGGYSCPTCSAFVFQNLSTREVDYCVRCGQALDWSDVK